MRTRIGITLAVAVLLGDPTTVLAQPVLLGDSTGSNYTGPASTVQSSSSAEASTPGTLPTPSEDPTNPANGPSQAPADNSNTTIHVAPEAGLGAVLGNNGTAINTTIVQQLTFSGAFAESVDSSLIASQLATINALPQSQVEATNVTYVASTTVVMSGTTVDTGDTAVSNALVTYLVPVVQNILPNATAAVTVLNNFTVDGSALEATVQLLNGSDVYAPNATLSAFLAGVASGTFEKEVHQAATAALDPNAEGGRSSAIPATTLSAMQTCQVSILAGSTTLEPTAQVQVNVTQVQPNVDAGLTLSNALKQSVTSGRLGSAISSAVGYGVSVSSDSDNQMYILAQTALTQAQASAGITTTAPADNSKASPVAMPLTSIAGAILLLSLLA